MRSSQAFQESYQEMEEIRVALLTYLQPEDELCSRSGHEIPIQISLYLPERVDEMGLGEQV